MKKSYLPFILAAAGFLLGSVDKAAAFPRTRESADLSITFTLAPPAPTDPNAPPPVNPASGTATVDVTSTNGVETDSVVTFTLTNVADGTYDVTAILKEDTTLTPVALGTITVATGSATLTLPTDLGALDIATLNVATQATPADPNVPGSVATPGSVILTGTPTYDVTKWIYFANRPVVAGSGFNPTAPVDKHGKPKHVKPIHGHVLIQAKIVDNTDTRRKFLLVAHNGPANTTLTINLDGVAAGTFTTTQNGKMMVKSVDSSVRLAGVRHMTITDADGNVIAETDFFLDTSH